MYGIDMEYMKWMCNVWSPCGFFMEWILEYMESMWSPYGMGVEWMWNECGISLKCMESIWNRCGMDVEWMWNIPEMYGVHMEWVWNGYGIDVEYHWNIWSPYGMDVEWIWNISEMYGVHMEWWWNGWSMWNSPCGMMVKWMVHMEQSMWNGGEVPGLHHLVHGLHHPFHGLHYPFHIVHMHSIWNDLGRVKYCIIPPVEREDPLAGGCLSRGGRLARSISRRNNK